MVFTHVNDTVMHSNRIVAQDPTKSVMFRVRIVQCSQYKNLLPTAAASVRRTHSKYADDGMSSCFKTHRKSYVPILATSCAESLIPT